MLARAVLFAACAIVLALIIGQTVPSWIAPQTQPAAPPQIASVDTRPAPAPEGRQVALRAGPGGHVTVNGLVNDRPVTFLVDTGATMVVLSEDTAHRLGYHPARADFTQVSRTAGGTIAVAPIRIGEIRIDNILVRDVPAVVVPGDIFQGNLLGMSFLNRLRKFEFQGDRLVLTQ
jgi:aspartyl protease family protein